MTFGLNTFGLSTFGLGDEVSSGGVSGPNLSAGFGNKTASTTAGVGVTTDGVDGTLYFYGSVNASELAATVKTSGATQAISSAGAKTGSLSSLAAATVLYVHFVHRSAAGNDSAVLSVAIASLIALTGMGNDSATNFTKSNMNFAFYHLTTRALIAAKTGQTVTAGALSFNMPGLASGTMYRMVIDQDSNTTESGSVYLTAL